VSFQFPNQEELVKELRALESKYRVTVSTGFGFDSSYLFKLAMDQLQREIAVPQLQQGQIPTYETLSTRLGELLKPYGLKVVPDDQK
jgi:hypothetical protein